MNMLKIVAVPMHPEGRKFVAIFLAIAVVLGLLWRPLFWVGLVVAVWCYYFFRDPVRSVPIRPGLIVSPADGIVSLITRMVPPEELKLGTQERVRVSVFMNVFNCHVNRAPMSGTISVVDYHHGAFLNASLDKASEMNERNSITITGADGVTIGVTQIAGLVARRIVCWVTPGQALNIGERFGLIRFGSRLDVFLPVGIEPDVAIGQTAVAGETVLADLNAPSQALRAERI